MRHNFYGTYKDVVLKPFSQNDSELYRRIRNQSMVRQWFGTEDKISFEQQLKWYEEYLKKEGDYMFGIHNREGIFIGGCGIYDVSAAEATAEFGRIVMDKNHQGKGYGFQAVMAAIYLACESMPVSVLKLEVKKNNLPAYSVYRKAGFRTVESDKDLNNSFIRMKLDLQDSLKGQAYEKRRF